MAGLKLKFKENQLNLEDRVEETQASVPEAKTGVPFISKPELVEEPSPKTESSSPQRKKSNRYFYKVSNHHELFKIGSSFFEDYKKGVKSFAVSSTGYQNSQQTSILGLASFFDHKEDLKIAIVSDNLEHGSFKELVSISKKLKMELGDSREPCDYYSFYGHFDFYNLDQLLDISNGQDFSEYDEVFDNLVDNYDLLFWDVPELHKIKLDSERYFPVIMKFESLSIIVAQSLSNSKDVKEVQSFFMGYGISLKGLLFDTKQKQKEEEAKSEEKSFWRRIFG